MTSGAPSAAHTPCTTSESDAIGCLCSTHTHAIRMLMSPSRDTTTPLLQENAHQENGGAGGAMRDTGRAYTRRFDVPQAVRG